MQKHIDWGYFYQNLWWTEYSLFTSSDLRKK